MLASRGSFVLAALLLAAQGAWAQPAHELEEEVQELDQGADGECPAGPAGAACRGEEDPPAEAALDGYSFKAFTDCAIPAGNDIGEPEFMTVDEAKRRCAADDACKGFTFEGTSPQGPLSGGAVWINLKTEFDCVDAEWIGYRKLEQQRAVAPAPPPPPPPRAAASRALAVQGDQGHGIALCMTGQVRMLSSTHVSIEQYILEVMKPDVFVYGPLGDDGASPDLYGIEKYVVEQRWEREDIRSSLYRETKGASRVIDLEYLEVQGNWFGNQCLQPPLRDNRPGSAICLYYNQNKCLEMIQGHEEERGSPYEYVTVTRFDFRWLAPHPPLNLLEGVDAVWIPSGSDWEGGINDRHAFMPRRHADVYLGAWRLLVNGEAKDVMLDTLGAMKVNGFPGPNTECFLKARLAYYDITVERFPSVAYLTCTQRVKSRWTQCYGTSSNDAPGWLYKEEMEHAQRIAKCVRSSWTPAKMNDCKEDIAHLYRGFR